MVMNDKVKVGFRGKGKNKGLVFFCDFMMKRGIFIMEWLSGRRFATHPTLGSSLLYPSTSGTPKYVTGHVSLLLTSLITLVAPINESLILYPVLIYSI